jgi:hypothetical protein
MQLRQIGLLRLHLINHFCYSLHSPEVAEFIDKSFSAQNEKLTWLDDGRHQGTWLILRHNASLIKVNRRVTIGEALGQ